MTRRTRIFVVGGVVLALLAVGWFVLSRPRALVLTGIVTTDDVIVSPLVAGQVGELLVREGDSVAQNQLIARLVPAELQADQSYYAHTAEQGALEVQEGEASLRYQEMQTAAQINQAGANLATATAQQAEATTNVTNTKRTLDRYKSLLGGGGISEQDVDQAQTAYDVAVARLDAASKEIEAQRAALALAQSAKEQVAVRRNALVAAEQEHDAAAAQRAKANVRLSYTDLRAPIAGLVDVRAVRQGEVVNPGQPVITLINPDSLWVRADVEEGYIDRVRIGDTLSVRLPSGDIRRGAVFYRGVDAAFATQRDVSRTKRDIKTFEIRIRVDNHDRRLAVGMTAYVLFPIGAHA
jgi:HlyD family secretion protein